MLVKKTKEQRENLLKLKNSVTSFIINYKKRYQLFPWSLVNKISKNKNIASMSISVHNTSFSVKELIKEINKTNNKIKTKLKPSYYNFILKAYIKDSMNKTGSDLTKVYKEYDEQLNLSFKESKQELIFCLDALKELNKVIKSESKKVVKESSDNEVCEDPKQKMLDDLKHYVKLCQMDDSFFINIEPLKNYIIHNSKKSGDWLLLATVSNTDKKKDAKNFENLKNNVLYNQKHVDFHTCYLPGDVFLFIKLNDVESDILESSRSVLVDDEFGIPEDRKYPLDTRQHVLSAIKLFGHAEEPKKKELAKRINKAAKKYNIKIPETTQCYKYLTESYDIITESSEYEKFNPNFKKKVGLNFIFIDIHDSKAKKYLISNNYFNKNFKNILNITNGEIAVNTDKDKLAGYIYIGGGNKSTNRNYGFIQTLEVVKEFRGYGLSNKLLDDAVKKYNATDLTCYKDNKVALNLYKRYGFVIIGHGNTKDKDYWMKLKSKLTKDDKVMTESTDNLNNTLDKIKEFNKELCTYEYIIVQPDGKIVNKIKKSDYKNYKILSPSQFKKYKGGICWDYVVYENANFNFAKHKSFFFCDVDKDGSPSSTHTFLLFYLNNKTYWFESSWKTRMGIFEFRNEDDALSFIINKLHTDEKDFYIVEYNPSKYIGYGDDEFTDAMAKLPEYHYKDNKSVKVKTIQSIKVNSKGKIINESANTDYNDRENILSKSLDVLRENGKKPNVSKKEKDNWLKGDFDKNDFGKSLCIANLGNEGLSSLCTKVNAVIKPLGGKLSPDNYGTAFLTVKESEEIKTMERVTFIDHNFNEVDLNDFMLECLSDVDDFLSEDETFTEGANIEMTKASKKYISEIRTYSKMYKNAIKTNNFNDARKAISKLRENINDAIKTIKSIESDSTGSVILGMIARSGIMMIKTFIPSFGIGLTTGAPTVAIVKTGLTTGKLKAITIIQSVGKIATAITVSITMMKESIDQMVEIVNNIKKKDEITADAFNSYKNGLIIEFKRFGKAVDNMEKNVNAIEKKYKELEIESKKKEKAVKESEDFINARKSIYESCNRGEISLDEREDLLQDLNRKMMVQESEDISIENGSTNKQKFDSVCRSIYERCSNGEITLNEREILIDKARAMFLENTDATDVSKEADKIAEDNKSDDVEKEMEKATKKFEAETK